MNYEIPTHAYSPEMIKCIVCHKACEVSNNHVGYYEEIGSFCYHHECRHKIDNVLEKKVREAIKNGHC